MTMARANASGRRTPTIPRTGNGSRCRGGPVNSKTKQAIAAKTTMSTAKCQAGSDGRVSKGGGNPRAASLAPSRPLVGRRSPRPDSEPAVAAELDAPPDAEALEDPAVNLALGTTMLARLLREFGTPQLAIAAYNAGPHRVREWWKDRRTDDIEAFVELIPYEETRLYVKRVMVSWAEYRRLYPE